MEARESLHFKYRTIESYWFLPIKANPAKLPVYTLLDESSHLNERQRTGSKKQKAGSLLGQPAVRIIALIDDPGLCGVFYIRRLTALHSIRGP